MVYLFIGYYSYDINFDLFSDCVVYIGGVVFVSISIRKDGISNNVFYFGQFYVDVIDFIDDQMV